MADDSDDGLPSVEDFELLKLIDTFEEKIKRAVGGLRDAGWDDSMITFLLVRQLEVLHDRETRSPVVGEAVLNAVEHTQETRTKSEMTEVRRTIARRMRDAGEFKEKDDSKLLDLLGDRLTMARRRRREAEQPGPHGNPEEEYGPSVRELWQRLNRLGVLQYMLGSRMAREEIEKQQA